MTTTHFSEFELQQAAIGGVSLAPARRTHLQSCPLCQAQVALYVQLFAAAARVPAPAFDFDVAAAVVAQLPRPRLAQPWIFLLLGGLILGVLFVAVLLVGSAIAQVTYGLSTAVGAAMLALAGCLVAGQSWELLARHRQQLRQLALA